MLLRRYLRRRVAKRWIHRTTLKVKRAARIYTRIARDVPAQRASLHSVRT
jgi:hypothetical protein